MNKKRHSQRSILESGSTLNLELNKPRTNTTHISFQSANYYIIAWGLCAPLSNLPHCIHQLILIITSIVTAHSKGTTSGITQRNDKFGEINFVLIHPVKACIITIIGLEEVSEYSPFLGSNYQKLSTLKQDIYNYINTEQITLPLS